jgi:tight adherence protein B
LAVTVLSGALVGLLAAVGVWVAVAGVFGVAVRERLSWQVNWSRVGPIAGGAAVAWVVAWAATGWPMAGLVAAGVVVTVPMLLEARRSREAALAKTEALASWAEMLRDTISAHAGLNQAIAATARVAPEAIRAHVQTLAARAERLSLSPALRMFSSDVADPVADLIVAALVIADERQARNLTGLLTEIAVSARNQSAMRLRVETGRARTYTTSQALVGITLALVVGLVLFSPKFLEPYDSLGGQLVFGVVGGLFVAALYALVLLGRPVPTPRLLGGIEVER